LRFDQCGGRLVPACGRHYACKICLSFLLAEFQVVRHRRPPAALDIAADVHECDAEKAAAGKLAARRLYALLGGLLRM
jgi:hypothetical protein